MIKSETSVKITKIATIFVGVALAFLMVFSRFILKWYGVPEQSMKILLIAFYICCVPAWIAVVSIFRLMKNIEKDSVFSSATVKLIRTLSWCCFFVSAVCFVMGFFDVTLWIFGLGSSFMTLILRVLKNVMQKACELKDENDMTI